MGRRSVKSQLTKTQGAALHATSATQASAEACEAQASDAEVPTGRGSLGTGPGKECQVEKLAQGVGAGGGQVCAVLKGSGSIPGGWSRQVSVIWGRQGVCAGARWGVQQRTGGQAAMAVCSKNGGESPVRAWESGQWRLGTRGRHKSKLVGRELGIKESGAEKERQGVVASQRG
jgi:hypothetical protein